VMLAISWGPQEAKKSAILFPSRGTKISSFLPRSPVFVFDVPQRGALARSHDPANNPSSLLEILLQHQFNCLDLVESEG